MRPTNAEQLLAQIEIIEDKHETEITEVEAKDLRELSLELEITRKQQSENRLKTLREIHARIRRDKNGQR